MSWVGDLPMSKRAAKLIKFFNMIQFVFPFKKNNLNLRDNGLIIFDIRMGPNESGKNGHCCFCARVLPKFHFYIKKNKNWGTKHPLKTRKTKVQFYLKRVIISPFNSLLQAIAKGKHFPIEK